MRLRAQNTVIGPSRGQNDFLIISRLNLHPHTHAVSRGAACPNLISIFQRLHLCLISDGNEERDARGAHGTKEMGGREGDTGYLRTNVVILTTQQGR